MNDYRPDPDALLAAIQKDASRQQRGKFKIFLGMAAGVGKTYAMLDAARLRQQEGVDVVVGYVETHGRAETDALVRGLEVVPRLKLNYRETVLEDMDVDAVLARKPELALVDELAHTNAPGARHLKRYQDVIDLLEAGIDVWTTVNVQHFESRSDAVQRITGIHVQETVPDSLIDLADEIELVDLSPDDLRKRLLEGKVYTPERIEMAANNFFRVGNLTALREMALRLTAEHVDHKLQDYMQLKHIAGPWKSVERLMVAVGPSPFSEQLIRGTRRIAYNLEAPWLAVHVQTSAALTPEAQERLASNIALARRLGAEVLTLTGDDVAEALLRLARQRNVTQIVVGKPQHTYWHTLLRGGSLVDYLIRRSGDIDIYVVTGEKQTAQFTPSQRLPFRLERKSRTAQYITALVITALTTIVNLVLVNSLPWLSYQTVGLTDLMMVLLVAAYIGRGPALVAATASAISWNFLFIEPRLTFTITQSQDVILFILYFVIAFFTGNLAARIRAQERQASFNAERTMALYTLAHETATAVNMDHVLQTAVTQIGRVFDAEVAILLPAGTHLERVPHLCSTLQVDEKDYGVAQWVYQHGKPAGRFTDTLSLASAQYHPLLTPTRTVGVIGITTRQNTRLSFDQEVLLETFLSQIALVIEREMLDEAAEQSAMLRESERLYTTLLNSISHELRTPIATIKGASSSLLNSRDNREVWSELTRDIQSAADRLNRLVENLLDMSRLESGRLQLKRDWCDLGDIIGVAIKQVAGCAATHDIHVKVAPNLPLVKVDFSLMEQVIVNLLDNACSYTPDGTVILCEAVVNDGYIELIVQDRGRGIPPELLERVFDKFYRLPGSASGGTGLGLSISRGLVEAHGGTLTAENNLGARFVVRLPHSGSPPPVEEAPYD
ncbi:MAG: sensor histidine kinase KdpD [Anaerolineae bacterium]